MKDNTRLLILLQLDEVNAKGWGYDAPFFATGEELVEAIKKDFVEWPANQGVTLTYNGVLKDIDAKNAEELAAQSLAFLLTRGATL